MKSKPIRLTVSGVRKYLGPHTWYTWHKCCRDLGIPARTRRLTIDQTKVICGWFFLHAQHNEDRSKVRCLAAFYAGVELNSSLVAPVLTGKEVLALEDRPSNATLYRRGLKHSRCYNAAEVQRFLER